ncbi:hypothetical protein FACS189446_6500 [Bacteroidia bacterium]|nr:hypothetical protein FACS189446_6500 [Bacteroidia bacterium]
MPARNPKSWNFYGSTDGINYTLIDSRSNVTFSGRNYTVKFILSQAVTYSHYKLEILSTSGSNPPQLSEISFENAGVTQFPAYSNYLRELDIEKAVAKVSYTQEGVNYTREYFVSHPDNALIIRLTADQPGMLSRNIWLTTPQTKATISAENATITLTGQPADQTENGLKFVQQLRVITSNGTVSATGKKLVVENADEIWIISSAATNYQQCTDDTYNYFSDTDPLTQVQAAIDKTGRRTYADVLETHVTDYQSLFNRMSLHFTGAANSSNKMTNTLLVGYRNKSNTTAENLYLEELYYQFGRYLLISSSRKNGLPANLQGIWAEGLTPPWAADYHTNINIQMNYWLAEQTNLADCHWPAIDYVKSLVPRGKYTAQRYFYRADGQPMRGWVDFHENNIWGNTGPAESDAFYFPAAAGWLCQDIWEYYRFNQDKAFLEEYFPVMLDAALFWVDNLWTDTRDNSLVSSPSYSPEHGPYSLGASCDQAIIAELFDMVIKADGILNPSQGADSPEIAEIKAAQSRLAGPKIGLGGQFMEWKDETTMDISGDNGHRHVNHLFWLHPGSQIIPGRSAQEDLFAEAMKKTLNTRGDGGTGWSKAWKINFWARLRDGNHSHKLLEELLKESTLTNLFDTHPPFQIDGNFGATAGMTEMLVQSQGDLIELLPSLPSTWSSGSFRGIKARGNFELNTYWSNGAIFIAEIISHSGNVCTLRYKNISTLYKLVVIEGEDVTPTILDENTIQFETTPGGKYSLLSEDRGIHALPTQDKMVEVYPNPAKAGEKITVKVNGNSPVNYCIVNTSGVILQEGKLQTGKNELTLPGQKGVFILTDHTGKQAFWSKIIIH